MGFYHQEKPYVAVVKDEAGIGRTTSFAGKIFNYWHYAVPSSPKRMCCQSILYYVVRYMHLEKYFSGATIPHIYFRDYKNEEFNLDDLGRQAEIIDILGRLERLIEFRKKELQQLGNLIKARFVEMFGDLKLNPFGWDLQSFEDLTELITDGEHATPRRVSEGIYLLSARNVLNHSLQLKDVDYIDQEEYDRIAKRIIPREGDVLISCSGTVGKML